MSSFRNLSIGARLGTGFALVVGLLVLVAVIGLYQVRSLASATTVITQDRMPKIEMVSEIMLNTQLVGRAVRNLALTDDRKVEQAMKVEIEKYRGRNGEIIAKLTPMIRSGKGKELLERLGTARDAYVKATNTMVSLADSYSASYDDQKAVAYLFGEYSSAAEAFVAAGRDLAAFQKDAADKSAAEAEAGATLAAYELVGVSALAALLAIVFGWWVTRTVTGPVARAARFAETIAAGDLTQSVKVDSTDEVGKLLASMNRMNESLRKIVGEVRAAVDTIKTGTNEIATGTQDLSSRTEEQASNLEQTAASMEELTATAKQSAESARQANQLASGASGAAQKGGDVVSRVVTTMEQITQQSHKIAEIIGVIDGIAFQTNILALNASVEAARAGEQGRGFAVVAGEVRNLAQRAAEAAKEIKTLINASVEQVAQGGKLVNDAGDTMKGIVDQVKQVSDLIGEITAASREEGDGISQINDAVVQLDQVTQQNAALVEESAAAADSLRAEAERLADVVSVFRVDGMHAVRSATPVAEPVGAVREPVAARKPRPALAARKPAALPSRKDAPKALPAPAPAVAADARVGGEKDWEEF